MKNVNECLKLIDLPQNLFSILSNRDNLIMFCVSKDGLNMQTPGLQKEIPTRKRYFKALKQLKNSGLVELSSKERGTYFHTHLGTVIYQKEILEIGQCIKYLHETERKNTCKQDFQYLGNRPNTSLQEGVKTINIDTERSISSTFFLTRGAEISTSYKEIMSLLGKKIRNSKSDILIATRMFSEELIKELIDKTKTGVKVKVLADTKLVKSYYESQNIINSKDRNNIATSKDTNQSKENERQKMIGDPWYPNNKEVQRRVCEIPFGIIIIDGEEVGIELVNQNDNQNLFGIILVKDKRLAAKVKEFYLGMWQDASDNAYIDLHK